MKNIFYIFIFLSFSSFSQNEGNIWYFGENAGLDFNSGVPVALTNGMLNTREGCASISDNNGDLLFYTDGMVVYNKNHILMPNGSGLLGNSSSTQSAVIIKKPGSTTIYYIITVDHIGGTEGLCYSEVDLSLDGGQGDVNGTKNIQINSGTCEKLTAIKHQNGTDFWIITRLNNSYHTYLVNSSGINMNPVISNIGLSACSIGQLKGSPDGNKITAVNFASGDCEIIDFDNLTGILNNPTTFNIGAYPYGVEFSPNSSLIYISEYANGTVYQYEISSMNILEISPPSIFSGNGSLQLAPDGKIYLADEVNSELHVISNPNTLGLGCNFVLNSVPLLGKVCRLGLPTFFSSIFLPPVDTCYSPQANLPDTIIICDTNITLTAGQAYTYLWSTGETTQSIIVNQSGDYWVQVCDATLGEVIVYENDFDSFIGSEWSDNTSSTYNGSAVLGNFNNASTALNLSNLPAHTSIKAVFDLYLLDSWDGNAGPDIWNLSIDGSSTINTTFSNITFGAGAQQSYPGNYPSINSALSGSFQIGLPNICFTGMNSISSLYKMESPFSTHSATSASIDFSASGLEPSCNESWAIDSVIIYVDGALSCCATEFVHVELTAPLANLGPDIITCDSLVTLTASGGYTYLWNTGDTTQSIIVDTTGNYQVITCDTFLAQQIIYESNFGVGIGPIWNTTSSYPINGITALGQFSNETISLSLNNILPHDTVLVEFDLYIIATWDGNASPGPDFFTLRTDGVDMMHTTFSNQGQDQSYPDDYLVNNPTQTGMFYLCANCNPYFSMYKISKKIYHTNANAVIDFIGGPGLQSLGDENWAISNIKISKITNECCATEDINVQIKCPPTNSVITDPTCNGYADASIDLTFIDGTMPQSIIWENSSNTFLSNMPNITNLIAGEYIVSTTCGLTCLPVIDTIIVPDPPILIIPGIKSDISCFGLNNGSVNITVSALDPLVVSTQWSSPNGFNSILEDINNLSAGLYSVLVTDANNCFTTEDFVVSEPDSILPNPNITAVLCYGENTGSAVLSPTGGITPYVEDWGTAISSDLYSGTYTYSITDSNNCLYLGEVIIIEPEPILPNPIIADVLCNGDSTGITVLSPTGGTAPYNVNWGANNPNSLPVGSHSYTITDNNDCPYSDVVIISQSNPIVISTTQQNLTCYGDFNGWCTISIIGGISPYTVDWYGVDSSSLSAGTYMYSVSDVNNCILSDSVIITEPDSLNVTYTTTDVQCYSEPTGDIDINVLLVNPPYSYLWINTSNPSYMETVEDVSNLYAGAYLLTVLDADLCAIELQIIVSQPTPISEYLAIESSNYNGFNIACKTENSGWISLEVSGGYIPFTYAWNTGESTDSISNLYADIYNVTVTDGLGCSLNLDSIILTEPDTILTGVIQATTDYNGFNISCFNGIDGEIREIPSGGVPPYTWFWDGLQGSEYENNKTAGYHNVELYDNNNCLWENNIILTEPSALSIQNISVTDTCERAVGEIYINVSGGVFPYIYLWSSGQDSDSINNLTEGIYMINSTDDNLCEILDSISVLNLKIPEADFHTYPDHRRFYDQLENPFLFIDISNTYLQNIIDWQWDFGDNTFGTDSIASHSYAEVGEYTILLSIETEYNCWDTISKKILIDEYDLYIPNAFTPFTGDFLNDEFKAYGYGIKNYTMKIYNRWGGIIFESDSINIGWDGTINDGGTIAPIGIYVYYIAVENIYGEIFKYEGQLNLIR